MNENAVTSSVAADAARDEGARQLAMDSADDERLPRFLDAYTQGPQTPEPGAPCDGGIPTPMTRTEWGRLAARGGTVIVGGGVGVAWGAPPAWAHESIEDAFARGAGPPAWFLLVVAWSALGALLGIAVLAVLQHWWPSVRPWPRHWAVTAWLLALWVLLGSWQAWTARPRSA